MAKAPSPQSSPIEGEEVGRSKEGGRVELKTKRLLLRPFRVDDVDAIFGLASDPAWSDYLFDVAQPYTRRDAEKCIARALLASWETTPSFAIVLRTEVIGEVYLGIDNKNETAELGHAIGRAQWEEASPPRLPWR